MISNKKIENAKIKMIKSNIKYSDLAKILNCSKTSITIVFNRKKDLPNIEFKILSWINKKENE